MEAGETVRTGDVRRVAVSVGACLVAFGLLFGSAGISQVAPGGPGGLPSPAADGAAPVIPAGVPVIQVQRWLAKALTERLDALSAVSAAVAAARNLTAQDRAALSAVITADQSGLASLSASVASETSLTELRETAAAMVVNFRVFALVVPEVRSVIGNDRVLAEAVALTALEPSIQTAITTERNNGRGAVTAQRVYQKLVAELSGIESSLAGTSASLLALTPQDAALAQATFAKATSAVTAASAQLVAARMELREIVRILGA